jgi:hypothetical protein
VNKFCELSDARCIFVAQYPNKVIEDELHFPMYCPSFENHRRELFSNVLNYNAAIAILSAEDNFVWVLSNEDASTKLSSALNIAIAAL